MSLSIGLDNSKSRSTRARGVPIETFWQLRPDRLEGARSCGGADLRRPEWSHQPLDRHDLSLSHGEKIISRQAINRRSAFHASPLPGYPVRQQPLDRLSDGRDRHRAGLQKAAEV